MCQEKPLTQSKGSLYHGEQHPPPGDDEHCGGFSNPVLKYRLRAALAQTHQEPWLKTSSMPWPVISREAFSGRRWGWRRDPQPGIRQDSKLEVSLNPSPLSSGNPLEGEAGRLKESEQEEDTQRTRPFESPRDRSRSTWLAQAAPVLCVYIIAASLVFSWNSRPCEQVGPWLLCLLLRLSSSSSIAMFNFDMEVFTPL